ncbi:GNAT family N-acetyltransferase [Galbibacter sp. EGI 63066]|uniref:GNAT family N-acetyltransferase n=1 Tax=Galbibacter sp. EGI 63066 TaxID=2993559 RepID=UPI002248E9A3|nr:GNAT family N-acetyltransferase [Galbibacter sp. EGI 63066]MCX2678421.1 GNAT family N-acetyltransferase [Galbibacter sp. EGI 63066]
MNFRKAKLDDIQELNQISLKSKKYWGYPDQWIENWSDELTLTSEKFAEQEIVVGEIETQVVGFCSISENKDNYEILHLWLLPNFIGKGYGKKLLTRTIEEFVKTDKPIIVEADPNAEPFYKSQGFVTFDSIESVPSGRFLPVMKKTIAELR